MLSVARSQDIPRPPQGWLLPPNLTTTQPRVWQVNPASYRLTPGFNEQH